jgi:cystathionine beta-lyase/cystathionine gamma-synthase
MMSTKRIETQVVHAGEAKGGEFGPVAMPIFQSSTFVDSGRGEYHNIRYIRLNNTPNHDVLHAKLATLEDCEAALVTSSGMSAISTTLLAFLKSGDHVLAQDCLYGGTHSFLTRDAVDLGVTHSFLDGNRPETWESHLRPNTRVIYVESVTNPLLRVIDLEQIVKFAKKHRLISIIDNTFPTPVNFKPAPMGFDIIIHSATKYLNGHTDLVAGCVMGSKELIHKIKLKLDHLGGSLDPHGCWMLNRGLKTLVLRMRAQNENALSLARHLERNPAVKHVIYPGLENHPEHKRARAYFGGFGGMIAMEIAGGVAAADRLFSRLSLPFVTASLGGVETLITRPARTSHSGMKPEERLAAGITDSLIRISVGIEAVEDLMADFDQALAP